MLRNTEMAWTNGFHQQAKGEQGHANRERACGTLRRELPAPALLTQTLNGALPPLPQPVLPPQPLLPVELAKGSSPEGSFPTFRLGRASPELQPPSSQPCLHCCALGSGSCICSCFLSFSPNHKHLRGDSNALSL